MEWNCCFGSCVLIALSAINKSFLCSGSPAPLPLHTTTTLDLNKAESSLSNEDCLETWLPRGSARSCQFPHELFGPLLHFFIYFLIDGRSVQLGMLYKSTLAVLSQSASQLAERHRERILSTASCVQAVLRQFCVEVKWVLNIFGCLHFSDTPSLHSNSQFLQMNPLWCHCGLGRRPWVIVKEKIGE